MACSVVACHGMARTWRADSGAKALLAVAVTRETYGRAFGFERMLDTFGAIVGPATASAPSRSALIEQDAHARESIRVRDQPDVSSSTSRSRPVAKPWASS